ncbi:hypothetical protein MSL71_42750 [Desulfoluna butyratoxydans]|uniref:Uncharacterized protein n=1 Tax=Desulfoluna butyratoxydans TaxID=231438 RepID=A0A4U8YQN5_9BACT|nr:hypothetical protein MSL71_42750 [Desulfoluna butyratoxydans]
MQIPGTIPCACPFFIQEKPPVILPSCGNNRENAPEKTVWATP